MKLKLEIPVTYWGRLFNRLGPSGAAAPVPPGPLDRLVPGSLNGYSTSYTNTYGNIHFRIVGINTGATNPTITATVDGNAITNIGIDREAVAGSVVAYAGYITGVAPGTHTVAFAVSGGGVNNFALRIGELAAQTGVINVDTSVQTNPTYYIEIDGTPAMPSTSQIGSVYGFNNAGAFDIYTSYADVEQWNTTQAGMAARFATGAGPSGEGGTGLFVAYTRNGGNYNGAGLIYEIQNAVLPSQVVAPVNTVLPVASGVGTVGSLLTSTAGTWTGLPVPVITYQWLRNGANISGATSATYTLQAADAGTNVSVRATGTNVGGNASVTSNAIAVASTQNGFFGNQTTAGGGNWGFSADRAMGNIATNANTAILKKGYLYIIPASGSGTTNLKMCVYSNVAGNPGIPLAISAPTAVSSSGWIEFNFNDEIVAPGQVHILAVASTVGGAGWDMGSFNSGGSPAAQIFNGTFSYASPPNPCPAPTTQYNNGLAAYVTYTY